MLLSGYKQFANLCSTLLCGLQMLMPQFKFVVLSGTNNSHDPLCIGVDRRLTLRYLVFLKDIEHSKLLPFKL